MRIKNLFHALAFTALCLVASCATQTNSPSGPSDIPNLQQVEPGIFRSGQPTTPAQWVYVRDTLHATNIIKLNTVEEGADNVPSGMHVYSFPITTMQQMVEGPNPTDMKMALALVGPGTLIHCEHGQDRTGLLVGLYRLQEGWGKDAAFLEMKTNKFHTVLHGLNEFWENQK